MRLGSMEDVAPGITWYEVLGVLPTASAQEVKRGYDAKAVLLKPEVLSGAPSTVLKAASRARGILDSAWWALGDAARRADYDEAVGIRRVGDGLVRRESIATEAGWGPGDFDFIAGSAGAELMGALMALSEFLGLHPHEPRRITVPDVRGLFYKECLEIVGRIGFRVTVVRLTQRPMPVDGLVVDQSPVPQAKARRDSALTIQVWHPPQTRA
jgi:curved DNA-binding protein CbpA